MIQEKKYHHHDLRHAIIMAALDILETKGLEGLSIRSIAGQIGVSHAAPKHHFQSLLALHNALAIVGFERLSHAMTLEKSLAKTNFKSQMQALKRGYLSYAKSNPALFRLMFNENLLDWKDENLRLTARIARNMLAEACSLLAISPLEQLSIETLFWSHIHGLAHLMIDGQLNRVGLNCSLDNLMEDDYLINLVRQKYNP